jgi:hypothetical protein
MNVKVALDPEEASYVATVEIPLPIDVVCVQSGEPHIESCIRCPPDVNFPPPKVFRLICCQCPAMRQS